MSRYTNPGAFENATGADFKAGWLRDQDTTGKSNPAIGKQIADRHKRAARCIGYALFLGDLDNWLGLVPILRARLNDEERAALAFASLKALDRDQAERVVQAAFQGAEVPLPSCGDPVAEAAWWAARALPDEIEAYALATFRQMPRGRQDAFRAYIGRAAA